MEPSAVRADAAADRRVRLLAEALSQLVWFGTDAGIDESNGAWSRYVGVASAAAPWLEAVHPDERALAQQGWDEAARAGMPFEFECRLRRADGAYRWFQVRAVREPDARRWIGCCADVDEARRAQGSLSRRAAEIQLVADSLPSVIAYVDAEQRCRFVNRAYERWFARPRAEILGRALVELAEPSAYDHARPWYEQVLRGQAVEFEASTTFPDGVARHAHARYLPDFDERGGVRGFVVLIDDVSAHKRVERLLRESEERIAAEARELGRSNAELTQFAHVASHDLQAPLRLVKSFLTLLEKRSAAALDADGRDFVAEAIAASQRMQDLINDLLEYGRAGSDAAQIEPVELGPVAERVLSDLRPQIAEAGAVVALGHLPRARCDRRRVTQVLQNLIGNAIKFRGADAPRVTVQADEGADEWTITIADNGIGIDPEHHQRVFEAFKRLHTGGEFPGTGIGLAICKRVVEQMRGRIWIESEPGRGSRFRFTLPKA